jgi:colanic acid/amylovoran biosynthesis protein
VSVVITGITGLRNRGVEAMLIPSIDQLRLHHPNLRVTVLTATPDFDAQRLEHRNVVVGMDEITHTSSGRLQHFRRQGSRWFPSLAPGYQASMNAIQNASFVLALGGDVFGSEYGDSIYCHLRPLEIAMAAGVPVIFAAQSIGPFRNNDHAQAWLKVARRAELITVREALSYQYVTQTLKVPADKVIQTADPAFLLEAPPTQYVKGILTNYGIAQTQPIVAFAISQGIHRYNNLDETRHLHTCHQMIKMLVEDLEAQVLLIPHVQRAELVEDDRRIATELLRKMHYHPKVRLAGADHTASEFKGLIGACNFVIAERMHAAIAGLSSGVPTVVVGYSAKGEGIISGLLGRELLNVGFLVPADQLLEAEVVCTRVKQAWLRRDEAATILQRALPTIKQMAAANFETIVAAVFPK